MAVIIPQYKEHLSKLASELDALAKEIEEYKIIQSITLVSLGEKIAATTISKIGEIDRFNHPKKLVAFAGIDPSVYFSGRFAATKNRITERGSNRLRQSLYMAVQGYIRNARKQKTTDELSLETRNYATSMIKTVKKENLLEWLSLHT